MSATVDDLRCHWRRCASPGPYADDKALYDHLVLQHCGPEPASSGNFICLWEGCPIARPTCGSNRARHLLSHTAYRPFVCRQPGCTGKAYKRRTALVHHHLSKHHDLGTDEDSGSSSSSDDDSDEASESSASGNNGGSDGSLSALSDSAEDEDTARLECLWADCDTAPFSADYAGAAELAEHLASHFTAKKCMWGACRQSLRRGAHKSHLLTHLPEWYRPYECDMCERSFGRSSALKHHQTATHPSSLGKRDREESAQDESARKKHRSLRSMHIDCSSARGSKIAVDELPTSDERASATCACDKSVVVGGAAIEAPENASTAALLEERLLSAETKIQQLELQVRELLRGKACEASGNDQLLDPTLFTYDD